MRLRRPSGRPLAARSAGLFVLLLAAACASSGPNLGALDPEALLDRGLQQLQDEKWSDAIRALEQFIFQYPTHERYQEARFRLGEAYYGRDDYLTAASEFSRLADDFPTGPWADDARFNVCRSYHELSPIAPRDQQYTISAIEHCQSLLAFYPDSEFAPEASRIVNELQNKLAQKEFLNGEFYFRARAYDSAIIVFKNLVERFPSTESAPQALLRLYQSYTEIGYTEDAANARERLLREYPDSEAALQLKGPPGRPDP